MLNRYKLQASRQRRIVALQRAHARTGDRRKLKRLRRIQQEMDAETVRQVGVQMRRTAEMLAPPIKSFIAATESLGAGLRRALARPDDRTIPALQMELLREQERRQREAIAGRRSAS